MSSTILKEPSAKQLLLESDALYHTIPSLLAGIFASLFAFALSFIELPSSEMLVIPETDAAGKLTIWLYQGRWWFLGGVFLLSWMLKVTMSKAQAKYQRAKDIERSVHKRRNH